MATTVAWEINREQWMVDNQAGDHRFFDDKGEAIQSAIAMERKKNRPDKVLVYKKDGKGIADNIPVS